MEKQISEIDGKVDNILMLLQGNELDKNDNGFLGKVNTLEKKVSSLEDFKKKVVISCGLLLALPTAYGIFSLIAQFIKQIAGK